MESFFNRGYVQFLMTLIMVGVLIALGSYARLTFLAGNGTPENPTMIQVTGMGEVLAKPDIGSFSFAVLAEGETATEAQEGSAEAINAIMAYLKGEGIEERDIKTQYYNLSPRYRYEERVCVEGSYCPPGNPVIDGYEVSQNITVRVRDLESAGELISGVGDRGATNISGLNFTIDDETVLQAEARKKAIDDAKLKAAQLADDLGMELVRIVDFYENGGNRYPMYNTAYGGDMAMEESMSLKAAPSVPTGENSIVSNVSLTVELR